MPASGTGNITTEPGLASASHLLGVSPCRGAGSAAYATGTDIDGEAWLNPPSIGCDEYYAGSVTGMLAVAVSANWTNVVVGVTVQVTGNIEGRASVAVWDFGDGVLATNLAYPPSSSHFWSVPGTYPVVLTAYNDSNPGGVSATVTVQVVTQPVHYVSLDSAAAQPALQLVGDSGDHHSGRGGRGFDAWSAGAGQQRGLSSRRQRGLRRDDQPCGCGQTADGSKP